jgi:hypothetical protein
MRCLLQWRLVLLCMILPWSAYADCGKNAVEWKPVKMPEAISKMVPDVKDKANMDGAFTVLAADINGDGVDEIFVRYDFDAGNHETGSALFARKHAQYKPIFEADVGLTNYPLTVLSSSTHGYRDLCVEVRCCGEVYTKMYRFDGTKYKESKT